jgi:hypothetical protein
MTNIRTAVVGERPTMSSEFERTLAFGSSVWATTDGARGSVVSTPVKFLSADSCASQMLAAAAM